MEQKLEGRVEVTMGTDRGLGRAYTLGLMQWIFCKVSRYERLLLIQIQGVGRPITEGLFEAARCSNEWLD